MNVHVAIDGIRQAPQSESDVRAKIARGEIPATALCWREGWTDWKTVGSVYAADFPTETTSGASPEAVAPPPAVDAEAMRRTHLNHEASVKSIGTLYFLGAIVCILAGVSGLVAALAGPGQVQSETNDTTAVISFLLLLGMGAVQFQVGRWLRVLNPRARTPTTLLACLGLLAFPLGTLINAYILYLVRSQKGAMVFSPDYAAVVAATPHIKYKTSLLAWVALIIVIAVVVGMVVAAAN